LQESFKHLCHFCLRTLYIKCLPGCPKVETPKGFLLALSDEGVDPSPLKNPPPAPPVEDPPKMDEVVVGLVLLLKMELDPVEG
jgi:hypothetical protein